MESTDGRTVVVGELSSSPLSSTTAPVDQHAHEQLLHEHRLLLAKQEEIERAHDELADVNDRQQEEIDRLTAKNKDLEALSQLRKDDLEDMMTLQTEFAALQDKYRKKQEELEHTKSQLRKANLQLEARSRSRDRRLLFLSSRNSSFTATKKDGQHKMSGADDADGRPVRDRRRVKSVAGDRLAMIARERVRQQGHGDSDLPVSLKHGSISSPSSPAKTTNKGEGRHARRDAASLQVSPNEIKAMQQRHEAQLQELKAQHAAATTALKDELLHETELRTHLQQQVRQLSRASSSMAEDVSPAMSASDSLSVSRSVSDANNPPSNGHVDIQEEPHEVEGGDSDGREQPVEREMSLADELSSLMGSTETDAVNEPILAMPTTTKQEDEGASPTKKRILLPVSATLTTELRHETSQEHQSDQERIQQQVIMDLEEEIAELREELEDLLEEKDSFEFDMDRLKAELASKQDSKEVDALRKEVAAATSSIEHLQGEHQSLQRRFLARGDQLITLRSICHQNGLNAVVARAFQQLKLKEMKSRAPPGSGNQMAPSSTDQLRTRLYTQVSSPSSVAARRVRAASMSVGKQQPQSHLTQHQEKVAFQQSQHALPPQPTQKSPRNGMSALEAAREAARRRKKLNIPVGDTSVSFASIPESGPHQRQSHAASSTAPPPPPPQHQHQSRQRAGTMSTRERLASVSGRLRRQSMSVRGTGPPPKPKKPPSS